MKTLEDHPVAKSGFAAFPAKAKVASMGMRHIHAPSNMVSETRIGKNFKIGHYNVIEEGVEIGDNVEIGSYCHIRKGAKIGSGTRLMDYIELRS